MQNDETFGDWLREQRERQGLTLREVEQRAKGAYRLPLSDTHLSQIETGKRPPPTISPRILFALALVYDLNMVEILSRLGPSAGVQLSYESGGPVLRVTGLPSRDDG